MRAAMGWLVASLLIAAPAMAQGGASVRIGVVESAPRALLTVNQSVTLYEGDAPRAQLPADTPLSCEASGAVVIGTWAGAAPLLAALPLRLVPERPDGSARTKVGPKAYRGFMEVRPGSGSLTVVNEVDLEDYLYGVVPAESIPSWPLESLKAQAVAARTYAMARRGQFAALGYDLKATVVSQVYGGVAQERPSTNRAVDETAGQILTYQGKAIDALYCDSTGGYTESNGAVWGTAPLPYLAAVPDFDQQGPRYTWEARFGPDAARAALGKLGSNLGELVALEVTERSFSGRARRVRVVGRDGEALVAGEKLRFAFGLRSTFFNAGRLDDGTWVFAGRGWGHGVGMSQWGAKGLADMGYTCEQILAHYYQGAVLARAGGTPSLTAR